MHLIKDVLDKTGTNFNMHAVTCYNEALKVMCTLLENFSMFQCKPSLLNLDTVFYFPVKYLTNKICFGETRDLEIYLKDIDCPANPALLLNMDLDTCGSPNPMCLIYSFILLDSKILKTFPTYTYILVSDYSVIKPLGLFY